MAMGVETTIWQWSGYAVTEDLVRVDWGSGGSSSSSSSSSTKYYFK